MLGTATSSLSAFQGMSSSTPLWKYPRFHFRRIPHRGIHPTGVLPVSRWPCPSRSCSASLPARPFQARDRASGIHTCACPFRKSRDRWSGCRLSAAVCVFQFSLSTSFPTCSSASKKSSTLLMASTFFLSMILAYICVVLIFACPNSFETV